MVDAEELARVARGDAAAALPLSSLAAVAGWWLARRRLRAERLRGLENELFLLQTLGDDRAVVETYVAGRPAKSAAA